MRGRKIHNGGPSYARPQKVWPTEKTMWRDHIAPEAAPRNVALYVIA